MWVEAGIGESGLGIRNSGSPWPSETSSFQRAYCSASNLDHTLSQMANSAAFANPDIPNPESRPYSHRARLNARYIPTQTTATPPIISG